MLGDPQEHLLDDGKIESSFMAAISHQEPRQGFAFGNHVLSLGQCFPDDASTPQRQTSGNRGVGLDGGPHPLDGEFGLAAVVEHLQHQRTGRFGDQGRDFAVEVQRDAIADVGLDDAFEPIGRTCPGVELVDGWGEGCHRRAHAHPLEGEVVAQQGKVAKFCCGQFCQARLVIQVGCLASVGSEGLKPGELAVGQHSEQVDNGLVIGFRTHGA